MFVVDLKYLKKVGLYYDEELGIIRIRKSSSSFRYPTLSCKLRDEGDFGKDEIASNLVFTLSYFVSDDFNKQQIEFTIDEWQQFGMNGELFKGLKNSRFFDFFSITNTLVMNVYKSRLKGRKAWKRRNFKLPFKVSSVRDAFGVGGGRNDISSTCSFDYVKTVERIVELDKLMNLCVHKACRDFSYAPFDVYFDCYKKKLKLERKMKEEIGDFEKISIPSARINRDKVFKEFAERMLIIHAR